MDIHIESNTGHRAREGASKQRQQIAWARETATGQLRFIGEIPRARTGLKCGCTCYGCGQPLEAVNASNPEAKQTPHFRHATAPETGACGSAVSKVLIRQELEQLKSIHLPARAVEVIHIGLSGTAYPAQGTRPALTKDVLSATMASDVEAILTLAEGQKLIVRLSGTMVSTGEGQLTSTIQIHSDCPLIAALAPEELRQKLMVLIEGGVWSGPDLEGDQSPELLTAAQQEAIFNLDWVPEEAVVEIGRTPSRETLLHWTAKEILSQLEVLDAPAIQVPWQDTYAKVGIDRVDCEIPGAHLHLSNLRLEQQYGRTRPDVLADAEGKPSTVWNGPLAIEVTVTNHVQGERLARMAAENIAFLEVDLSKLDRSVNYELLSTILQERSELKHWLYHPAAVQLENQLIAHAAGSLNRKGASALAVRFEEVFVHVANHPHTLSSSAPRTPELGLLEKELGSLADELQKRGYAGAHEALRPGELNRPLQRLYSLKRNAVVGYRLSTTWQVVNAILGDTQGSAAKRFHVHYLLALKVYQPKVEGQDSEARIKSWRAEVARECRTPSGQYYPSTKYNTFLELLFPEIKEGLQWRP